MAQDPDTSTAPLPDERAPFHCMALDDEHVCFDAATGGIVVVNDVGRAMWRALVRGHAEPRIVQHIAARFEAPPERIAADLHAFVEQRRLADTERAAALAEQASVLDPRPLRPFRRACTQRLHLPAADVLIELECDRLAAALLRVAQLPIRRIEAEAVLGWPAELTLRVWEQGGRYPVEQGGRIIDTGLHLHDAVTRVVRLSAGHAAARDGWAAVLHAAGIERDGRVIVMPGFSGSGKSTLAAWLVGGGDWRLVNDDQLVLRAGDLRIPPAPYPMSIKTGATALLQPRWPELPDLPVRRNRRGRAMRELVVPPERLSCVHGQAAAIVVPQRRGNDADSDVARTRSRDPAGHRALGSPATLAPVSRASVLRALLKSGLVFPGTPGWPQVQALVEWLAGLPCLRLHYADLASAERTLSRSLPADVVTRPGSGNR